MIVAYFDTSSILSYWIIGEIHHQSIFELFTEVPDKSGKESIAKYKFTGILSGLVLTEIASVVERQQSKFNLDTTVDLSKEYIRSTLKLPNIRLIDPIISKDNSLLTYAMYTESIQLAPNLRLKSLDNLHLSIVSLITKQDQYQISYFVTGDKEILENSRKIRSHLGITVVTPDTFLESIEQL